MSPPEVWGPAVWTLFHTLAEKINPNAYPFVFPSLFNIITKICKFLPCPECSIDASFFLAKIRVSDLKTKESFKKLLCVFHNTVNAKKRKPIFKYMYISLYGKLNLIRIVNNFISQYNTKGNMKLLNESFQRQFVVKDFKNWFQKYIKAFLPSPNIPNHIIPANNIVSEEEHDVTKKQFIIEEKQVVFEEQVVVSEEPVVVTEEQVVSQEEQVVITEEQAVVTEEQAVVTEEQVVSQEEQFVSEEEPVFVTEEQVVSQEEEPVFVTEEQVVSEENLDIIIEDTIQPTKKTKKNKKNKK